MGSNFKITPTCRSESYSVLYLMLTNLCCFEHCEQNFLGKGKKYKFPVCRSFGQSYGNSKGLEKNRKFWRGGGVNNFGIQRA